MLRYEVTIRKFADRTIRRVHESRQRMPDRDIDPPTEITDTIETPDRRVASRALFDLERWFLLDANRWFVIGLLAGATFTLTVLVGTFGPVSARRFLARGVSPATTLWN